MKSSKPFILEVSSELALPLTILEKIDQDLGIEEARDCAMTTSVGGIGPLLRDRLISQSEQGIDAIGVSLLYEKVWVQTRDDNGLIHLVAKNVGKFLRKHLTKTDLSFELPLFNGEIFKIDVWGCTFGQARGFFLSNSEIANVVYPGEVDAPEGTKDPGYWAHELKLRQNWMLGRGALTLSKIINKKPSIVVLSEAPSIFAQHKLFDDALSTDPHFSQTKYVFNDHTPLEYAHPLWDQATIDLVHLKKDAFENTPAWRDDINHVDVTSLAVQHSELAFGVSEKHEHVMRKMDSLKPYIDKISHITNGVHPGEWQSPELKEWEKLSDKDLLKIKEESKKKLIKHVIKYTPFRRNWLETANEKIIGILTRRITPYKRLDIINQLLENRSLRDRFLKLDVILLVGGRIHQQDKNGQEYASTLTRNITDDFDIRECLLFVDNFNVWEAPMIYQGADMALMISDNNREASSTGFMKAQMNGAAVIATLDGAIPEFVNMDATDPEQNGIEIPYENDEPTAEGLLQALEQYKEIYGNLRRRVQLIRSSLAKTKTVSIDRTVNEMKTMYDRVLSGKAASLK